MIAKGAVSAKQRMLVILTITSRYSPTCGKYGTMRTQESHIKYARIATILMKSPTEQAKTQITHRQLVESAYKWVLHNASCGVAFKELNSLSSNETPDVIGFGSWGHSVLVEAKASRSDFFSDRKKSFRKYPSQGMGSQRFYCCPTGMIKQEELPEGWGLLYVNEKLRTTCVHNPFKGGFGRKVQSFEKNWRAEHGLMYSALRRLQLRGRINEIYEQPI